MNKKYLVSLSVALMILMSITMVGNLSPKAQAQTVNFSPVPVPLSAADIHASYPALPTAAQLWSPEGCGFLDTRYYDNATSGLISNSTSYEPNLLTGGIMKNVCIWLQYNATVWVEVPPSYLTSSQTSVSPATATTWAIGAEADPNDIASGIYVTGACTYGEWTGWAGSQTNDFVCTVLSIYDGTYIYQIGIADITGYGTYLLCQYWKNGVEQPNPGSTHLEPTLDQQYPEYIQYNSAESAWSFSLQQNQYYTVSSVIGSIFKGLQPNVVIESNDLTSGDFKNFARTVGGDYPFGNGTIAYEAALTYQFVDSSYHTPGNWHPYIEQYSSTNHGHDPITGADVYEGSTACPAWNNQWVGGESPSTAGVKVGIQNPASTAEILQIGSSYSDPTTGTSLWSASQ